MFDLTHAHWQLNRYGGSEKKRTLLLNGRIYMVKFPERPRAKKYCISYINSQYSEHIGCKIFQYAGLASQNTFLGAYTDSLTKKEKIVVACEDFTQDGARLFEFSKIANYNTDSERVYSTTIEDIYDILNRVHLPIQKQKIKEFFWDMFVIDALIGNTDRHLDNWGLLEQPTGEFTFAPVYDCGSSLSPLYDDNEKAWFLQNKNDFKINEYNICSVYRLNNQRIFYHEIFEKPIPDLEKSIIKIVPRIQDALSKIKEMIANIEGLTDISKTYMIKSIELRNELILKRSFKKLNKRNIFTR